MPPPPPVPAEAAAWKLRPALLLVTAAALLLAAAAGALLLAAAGLRSLGCRGRMCSPTSAASAGSAGPRPVANSRLRAPDTPAPPTTGQLACG
jgi:hypothetical protein